MIPVYINHYKPLVDRKQYLDQALAGIDATWVTEPEKDDITKEIRDEWYLGDESTWKERCQNYYDEIPPYRELKNSDISCSLGHVISWDLFLKTGHEIALFLEDDIILARDFETLLMSTCSSIPSDLDVLFIGGGFSHTLSKTIGQEGDSFWLNFQRFQLKDNPATNCLCSYLLTRKAAEKLLDHIKPFTLPIDFEANYWFDKLNFKTYHFLPYIAIEGTRIGAYSSVQVR